MDFKKTGYSISTDKSKLDFEVIHQFLTQSYWSKNIPLELVKKAAANSLCFGVYYNETQIGYARIISDTTSFAYLADVFIVEEHRGKGLSKWLMQYIIDHPDLQGLRRWMLGTRDAHELYKKFGFKAMAAPDRFMELHFPNVYRVHAHREYPASTCAILANRDCR